MKPHQAAALALLALLLSATGLASCSSQTDSIVVAVPRFESSGLLWIAQDQGLFRRNGLNVTFDEPAAGAASLDELLTGQVEIATAAEFPAIGLVFQGKEIRVIGCVDRADYVFLIGRSDKAIPKIPDLRGKRVARIAGTAADFLLGRFLELNGLNLHDVTLVDLDTSTALVDAIASGSADAVVVGEPYATSFRGSLGAGAVAWPVQSGQPVYNLLIVSEEWEKNHPELVIRFLRSLAQAEESFAAHPAAAKVIVQQRLKVDASFVEAAWSRNQYSLSLDQSLIAAMEDEARWMVANGLVSEQAVPDLAAYVDESALKEVEPGAVHIIR